MPRATGDKDERFRPARWRRWWRIAYLLLLVLMESSWVNEQVEGDWRRALHAIPLALAFMIAFAGAIFLVALLTEGVRNRRWIDMSGWAPRGAYGWLQYGVFLAAALLYALHLTLPDKYPEAGGTDWAQVIFRLIPNTGDALALGGALAFFVALNWWLGFAERDRARAMERDRRNAVSPGGRVAS